MADADERKRAILQWVNDNPSLPKTALLAWLKDTFPDVSGGGHRGMVNRMYPPGESPWDEAGTPVASQPEVKVARKATVAPKVKTFKGPANPAAWENVEVTCPKCKATAKGTADLTEVFGWRFSGAAPQSWCRRCR